MNKKIQDKKHRNQEENKTGSSFVKVKTLWTLWTLWTLRTLWTAADVNKVNVVG